MSQHNEGVAGLFVCRGSDYVNKHHKPEDDDLVIIARGLYSSTGVETKSDKDTRKLAASPGRFTQPRDGDAWGEYIDESGERRRVMFKTVVIAGTPIVESDESDDDDDDDRPAMSAVAGA